MHNFKCWFSGASLALALLLVSPSAKADDANNAPDFKEVYDLIQSNLSGVTGEELNQAAVRGLVDQLHSKVALVSGGSDGESNTSTPLTVPSYVYDGGIIRLRISRVADGLADKVAAAEKEAAGRGTNPVKGLVLDLRYADGSDYQAAADTAGLFISHETPLLDWGSGMVNSKDNTGAFSMPVVALVNKQTAGAAEALAAVMREDAHAVVLGSTTAGEATVGKKFPLKNGEYLRIATAAVKLAGGDLLSGAGVAPDIQVSVKPDDARIYYNDPYKVLATTAPGTNNEETNGAAMTHRLSEADLIRERKERPGMDLEYLELPDTGPDAAPNPADKQKPVVRDPTLARALDLIKGIAAFVPFRAP